jgi:hypothetical protein
MYLVTPSGTDFDGMVTMEPMKWLRGCSSSHNSARSCQRMAHWGDRLPAVGALKQGDDVLPRAVDDRLDLGFACLHGRPRQMVIGKLFVSGPLPSGLPGGLIARLPNGPDLYQQHAALCPKDL